MAQFALIPSLPPKYGRVWRGKRGGPVKKREPSCKCGLQKQTAWVQILTLTPNALGPGTQPPWVSAPSSERWG